MWFGGGKAKQEAPPVACEPSALGSVPIFDGLSEDQRHAVLERCEEVSFEPGATLFMVDTAGDSAFFILSGAVVVKGADPARDPQEASGGSLLGELAMLVDVTYNATATAKDCVSALSIRRKALHEVMDSDPAIAEHFSRKLVNRLLGLADDLKVIDAKFAALEESLAEAV
jgi:CRP/FNR family transcriptional regulator, cyclic AMP receptor protein